MKPRKNELIELTTALEVEKNPGITHTDLVALVMNQCKASQGYTNHIIHTMDFDRVGTGRKVKLYLKTEEPRIGWFASILRRVGFA